ncbi:Kinesin-like protein KIF13B (Kinesin-like protein GAKIN) [Durusdinium trenchii]|uniref:Kinesin-like protein KIF13B (Kinesin-like protein GAKIN) n=1 Tax=Durusdinium trenchii TaxID=1381693 RepID=A0ABP0KAH9_9DINO
MPATPPKAARGGRPPLPKEEEVGVRKSHVKNKEVNSQGSLGLPLRLDSSSPDTSLLSGNASTPDTEGWPPRRHVRYESVPVDIAQAATVAACRRESEVATNSWPLTSPRDDESKRHLTMFFLDPAQLLADIKADEKEVALEDDDDTESKIEEEKDTTGDAATARSTGGSTPSIAGEAAKRSKVRRDNEYIQVAVRIRPFLQRNEERHERNILSVEDQQITVETRCPERKNSACESPLQAHRDTGTRTFKFDHVLDSRGRPGDPGFASQEAVFETIGRRIVSCALDGYNACLFAYGQTGAGKTHTVLGDVHSPQRRGLLPRVLEGLFAELAAKTRAMTGEEGAEGPKSSLQISYLEIFNEQIHDLLVPPKVGEPRQALQVRYHPSLGVMINDLTQSNASTIDEAMELVNFGTRMRSIASTSMNHRSSRAHTVFTFRFEQTSKDGETQMAQVQLVDLAGREQEKSSVDNKDRLKERQFINTSLFHLSTCIINLAKASSKGRKMKNLPDVRNSRLTLLLAHSLTGNSRTGMVAAVSPASGDLEETISTLRFADMVKQIRTTVTSNRVNKANLIKQLQEEIARLKSQMEMNQRWNADEQIAQLEAVIAHFKDALEQEKSRSQALAIERAACLKEMGLSVNTEGVSVVVGSDKDGVPYLVNLSEDPYLQGCLMYFLPGPEVTIGSSDGNKVRMSGLGMKPYHCSICNEGNRRLTLQPAPCIDEKDFPRVLLNGRRVTEKVEIQHQDRLIFGHAWAFRLAVPLTASELRASSNAENERAGGADNQAELDQALAEIEDSSSQSFRHLRKYVDDLQRCAGPEEAKHFVGTLHRTVPLVDEANQITREVGMDSYFELQVLTDLWSAQNLPEMVVAVLNNSRKPSISEPDVAAPPSALPTDRSCALTDRAAAGVWQTRGRGDLKFVWTFNKFLNRLQAMRDIYQEMCNSSDRGALLQRLEKEPFSNPWLEFEDHEIRMLILAMKPSLSGSPAAEARNVLGFPSPGVEARLMLHGYKSGTFGKSISDASLAPGALDAKSDELLAKSQMLMLEGYQALLQQNPARLSNRSVVIEHLDPEEESRMHELEMKVEEGMEKLQKYWGRRENPSVASSYFVHEKSSKTSAYDSRHWGAAPGAVEDAEHDANSLCSEENNWGIEGGPLEGDHSSHAVGRDAARCLVRPPTIGDALTREEALHAVAVENAFLEREVERQQAEIEELKKRRFTAAHRGAHSPRSPLTGPAAPPSRSGSKTSSVSPAAPRTIPCRFISLASAPTPPAPCTTPQTTPRTDPRQLCAYLPSQSCSSWVYAAPAPEPLTPRVSVLHLRSPAKPNIRPAFLSGCFWALGFACFAKSLDDIGYTATYMLSVIGPVLVSQLISVFIFKEIQDTTQLRWFAASCVVQAFGLSCIVLGT